MEEEIRQLGLIFLELDRFITSKRVVGFVTEALELYVPIQFFTIPASSSGKYHPTYALGVGGLLKHTKAAMVIAEELFSIHNFNTGQRQLIMAALALHDTEKPSRLHPVEVKLRLEPLRDKYPDVHDPVIRLIECHMGQWDNFGKMPQPKTKAERFVHMCDYLASRKGIHIDV